MGWPGGGRNSYDEMGGLAGEGGSAMERTWVGGGIRLDGEPDCPGKVWTCRRGGFSGHLTLSRETPVKIGRKGKKGN